MIILDTDCLSLLQRKRGDAYVTLFNKLSAFSPEEIATTIVSFDEQMRGWMSIVARSRKTELLIDAYADLESFLEAFKRMRVISFDERSGMIFDDLDSQKLRVGTMDLRIASIAMSQDAILVSRNLVDFERIPGLIVEDWTRENYIN